jgi:hypothetical protein
MYQSTVRAAAWNGAPADQYRSEGAGSVARTAADRTIWARVPFQTRRGRCVSVRLRGEVLLVGIAGSPAVQWLPAHQVLTDAEVVAWLAAGL